MSTQTPNTGVAAREILVGSSVGLLIGLLVGLSVSEVVAGVISGLVALLAVFLGFKGEINQPKTSDESTRPSETSGWRLLGFAVVGSVALLVGLVVRTHNLLGRTPQELVDSWTKAGYPPTVARELVSYQMLGLAGKDVHPSNQKRAATVAESVLFAGEVPSQCSDLTASRYPKPEERANAFINTGERWKAVGESVKGLDPAKQAEILDATWRLACNE